MVLSQVFARFVHSSPVSVMVRGLREKILSGQKLDELFERTKHPYIYTAKILSQTKAKKLTPGKGWF